MTSLQNITVTMLRAKIDDDQYEILAKRAFDAMTPAQREALEQLYKHGPVWDGDVISKAARTDLLDAGIASRAIVKGEEGYTVLNYVGGAVYRAGKE